MAWEGIFTLCVVIAMTAALVRSMAGPDMILFAGLVLLLTVGAFAESTLLPTASQAVASFGNQGLITIALLYIVVAGLTLTGATAGIAMPMLGRPTTIASAQTRLMLPVAALSAFLNNTPIVAMYMPIVSDWARKIGISPSKLFIPLSYAAILGGVCTLIGTSTNLVVNGELIAYRAALGQPAEGIGLFDIAWVGIPAAIVGIAYVLIVSRWLLPERLSPHAELHDARQYTVEMLVEPGGPVVGKTIEQAGLRHLPGLFLADIEREGERLVAVSPDTRLMDNDQLIFAGVVTSVADLQKIRGLVPATDQVFKLRDPRPNRRLIEAVVAESNPLVNKTIREGRFRSTYNAAVIAVHRAGHHVQQKIGDIVLRPGDVLLLEAHPRFLETHRHRKDFYLVSAVENSQPPRHDKAWVALAILGGMVALATLGVLTLLNAAMLAAALMIATRCCRSSEAFNAIEWRVLLVIGSALGIGMCVRDSGLAKFIAIHMVDAFRWAGPIGLLLAVYLLTNILTELIVNVGAAVLVFPIAMEIANADPANPMSIMPFVIVIMVAASASFATPVGYQTNLMVFGPGGYRFTDYLRFGIPLNLIVMAVTVTLTPLVWPL